MDGGMKKRLLRVLYDAYDQTPYFNNIINNIIDDTSEITLDLFFRLPLFNKSTIQEVGWLNFISEQYLDENYQLKTTKDIRLERTSGTTGNPMQILWNSNDYFSSSMNHWKYRSRYFNITPCSKMCTSSKTIPGSGLYYIKGNKLTFSIRELTIKTIPRIIEAINDFRPEWFYIQNSILYVLVYVANKLGLSFPNSVKYIEYLGEPICPYYREEIAKMIPAPTSNMYGCVETNGISLECEYGRNHLMSGNVFVEIVDKDGTNKDDGEIGYVCVTGLHNTAMPMIRYRLNDLASISKNTNCPCGNSHPTIQLKAARMPEFLIFDSPTVFQDAQIYCPINAGVDLFEVQSDDICFNLKMNTLDNYEVLVYQSGRMDVNVEKILRDAFFVYGLPDVKFTVKLVEGLNLSKPSGILRVR